MVSRDMRIDPKKIIYFAAFGIIFNEKREALLVLRNDMPMWELVGGCVDDGETHEQAMIREAKEEIDNNVTIRNNLGAVYCKLDKLRDETPTDGDDYYRHFQFYEVDIAATDIFTEEHVTFEWFAVDKLPKNLSPLYRLMIEKTYQDKKTADMIAGIMDTKAYMNGLTPEEVYKLDAWQKDAKVSAKAKTLPDRSPFLPLEE